METRFIDDLRRQALALSEEVLPFLERHLSADDRKSVAGLRRTAAQTRLTTLLMEAVAWLNLLDRHGPNQRPMRLGTQAASKEVAEPSAVEPALAELIQRVETFHRRLQHIETRLESHPFAYPDACPSAPGPLQSFSEAPAHT